jgi:hypothetical protein
LEISSEVEDKLRELLINTTLPALGRTTRLVIIGNNRTLKLLEGKGQALVVESRTKTTLIVEF